MARVFITGSSDGLGLMAARLLTGDGHRVVLHARNEARAADTRAALPAAETVATGDLSTLAGIRELAATVDGLGRFDAVIHNAGIGPRTPDRVVTADGLSQLFVVNVLAPYLLTALMTRPDRLVYLSSGMHQWGDASLEDLQWEGRPWDGSQAYSDTKLFDLAIAGAVGRLWGLPSSAVTPGWVATKMGGPGAPDDLDLAPVTQVWLAVGEEVAARSGGGYWYHRERVDARPEGDDPAFQDRLLARCADLTGVPLPQR